MSDELVERLSEDHARDCGWHEGYEPSYDMEWCAAYWGWSQAADEIERLRVKVERLEKDLQGWYGD